MMEIPRMNQRIVLVTVLAVAAACGKKGDEKSLEPAVFGKVVAPPGELGKLRLGMSVEEAKKAAPSLVPKDTYDSFKTGYKDVRFGVGLTEDKKAIDRLTVDLPKSARPMLDTAWGPGQAAKCASHDCTYWFDAASGTRALLEDGYDDDLKLEFSDYTPMEKLLGAKPGQLAFETGPAVLGATVDDLRGAYKPFLKEQAEDKAKDKKKSEWFELPPTAYESYTSFVHLSFAGKPGAERVSSVRFDVPYDDYLPAKDSILAAFDKAWGKGFPVVDNINRPLTVWLDPETGRRATLDATYEGRIAVEVEPYLPLAKFLGDGGPEKLGFETQPLIGMTWPEIEKAYPANVETMTDEEAKAQREKIEAFMGDQKGSLDALGEAKGGTTFNLPGTEWGDFTLVHLHYGDDGKVRQLAIDLPWGLYPESKDTILAALEKKYGPKKDITKYGGTTYELRAKDPQVTVENSDIIKTWRLQVGAD